ncbi:MAG: outer membrane beta-barrel protein [Bacteroidota bacterium]
MMTRLFFFFLLSVMCLPLSAQLTAGLKVQSGKAWLDYTFAEGVPPIDGYNQRITHQGVSAELFYQLQNPRLQVGIAPGYVQRGAACEPGFIGDNVFLVADATIYANYVQVPVLLRYSPIVKKRFSLFTQIGGGLGYLLSGYRDVSFWQPDRPNEEQALIFENEPTLNRLELGLQGGLGISYQLGPGQLQLSGDFYYGLTDMNQNFGSQHRVWSVGLGYAIRLSPQ